MKSIYELEAVLSCALKPLVPEGMIFTDITINAIETKIFKKFSRPEDRCAILIQNAGFDVAGSVGRSVRMLSKWRVTVVTPDELYNSVAGARILQVIRAVTGTIATELSTKPFVPITDTREFNQPDFSPNLIGVPVLFGIEVVL